MWCILNYSNILFFKFFIESFGIEMMDQLTKMTQCHFGQLINHFNSKRFNKKFKKQNIRIIENTPHTVYL